MAVEGVEQVVISKLCSDCEIVEVKGLTLIHLSIDKGIERSCQHHRCISCKRSFRVCTVDEEGEWAKEEERRVGGK